MRSADGGSDWDVFLAYASPDLDDARALHDALVAAGVRVFLDEKVLQPGDNWQLLVPQHLRAAEIVVVLISEHTDQAHSPSPFKTPVTSTAPSLSSRSPSPTANASSDPTTRTPSPTATTSPSPFKTLVILTALSR